MQLTSGFALSKTFYVFPFQPGSVPSHFLAPQVNKGLWGNYQFLTKRAQDFAATVQVGLELENINLLECHWAKIVTDIFAQWNDIVNNYLKTNDKTAIVCILSINLDKTQEEC